MATHVLSYGGGVNSTALFFYLIEKKKPLDLVIFGDTGEETDSTYDAVKRMKAECEKQGILFVSVQSKYGNMYDYYYSNKVVPSFMKRDCTFKFKITPIRQYLRATYGKDETFVLYIGITIDEFHRMKESDVKYVKNTYPFCDDRLTRNDNVDILRKYSFPAAKSGCKGCIFNKKYQWLKMAMEDPNEFNRWLLLEEQSRNFPKLTLCPHYNLRDILQKSKGQVNLSGFIEDQEPTCDTAEGGCFL